jgi:SAM-dependent methyltransferase
MNSDFVSRVGPPAADASKSSVRDFWERASCGEVYAVGSSTQAQYDAHAAARYALEPYLPPFARFPDGAGRDVLEIGVGMGADHLEWAKYIPRSLTGIDLTPRAVAHTQRRLADQGYESHLEVGDAERLAFKDNSFDIVYSWGVLHHSPDTARAVSEVYRVLRPGGIARVMIYHHWSLVGYMLWIRYALLAARPWRPLQSIYAEHLESPGTKAYSIADARVLFGAFSRVEAKSVFSFGDLLQGAVGQRHRGWLLTIAKGLWPRWLLRRLLPNHGLVLLIEAFK